MRGCDIMSCSTLPSTHLSWAQLSDGYSELNKCIKAAAKARSGVTPADCDEDVLATHEVEHQNVVQLVLSGVECVSCLLVNIDLQTHILLLTWFVQYFYCVVHW